MVNLNVATSLTVNMTNNEYIFHLLLYGLSFIEWGWAVSNRNVMFPNTFHRHF